MSSILIYGASQKNREDSINDIVEGHALYMGHQNIFTIELEKNKKNISIAQVRSGIKFLSTAPLTHQNKIMIINKAHLLTTQAQNVLLKILEEPPVYAIIILAAKSEESILPTIISRCKKYYIVQTEKNKDHSEYASFKKASIGDRFLFAEKLVKQEKDQLLQTLEDFIHTERNNISKLSLSNLKALTKAKNDLENTNINGKLVIEWLCVNLE